MSGGICEKGTGAGGWPKKEWERNTLAPAIGAPFSVCAWRTVILLQTIREGSSEGSSHSLKVTEAQNGMVETHSQG